MCSSSLEGSLDMLQTVGFNWIMIMSLFVRFHIDVCVAPPLQISTSSCGWFVLGAAQRREHILRRPTTLLLRGNSVSTGRDLLSSSTVSCTRCAITGLGRSTLSKVGSSCVCMCCLAVCIPWHVDVVMYVCVLSMLCCSH